MSDIVFPVSPETMLQFVELSMEMANKVGEAVDSRKKTGDTEALNKVELQTYGYLFGVAELFGMDASEVWQ